jgi:hypothetical protein
MEERGLSPSPLPLLVVDEQGNRLDRPFLAAAVTEMVRIHLAPLPGLMLPVVLKLRPTGMSELDAYAFDNRCLRVLLPQSVIRGLSAADRSLRAFWELRTRVTDLAANFRSRVGARGDFFRHATRSHQSVAAAVRLQRFTRELTPT